jgi:hypothetical protein
MNSSDNIDQFVVAHTPTDATVTAIDSAARDLGLKSVRAWVPDAEGKRRSLGAERAQRHRERKEHDGIKQISVMLPSDLHPALRELAKRTRDGESVHSALHDIFPASAVTVPAVPKAPTVSTSPTLPLAPATRSTSTMPGPCTAPAAVPSTASLVHNAPSFEVRLEMLLRGLPSWKQWLLRRLLQPLLASL